MRIVFFLFSCIFCSYSLAQNCSTISNGKVEVGIIKKTKSNSSGFIGKIKRAYTSLIFATGFNDSAIVYLNNTKIYAGYLKSEFSSGITKVSIPFTFVNSKKGNHLRIELPIKRECMTLKLKTNYKAIHIHNHNIWNVNYTNYILLLE